MLKFRSGEVQRRRKAGSVSKLNRVAGISWRLASRISVLVAERARQIREVNLINVSMWATADARIGSNAGSLVMAIQLLRFVTVGLVSSIERLPDPPRGRGHVDVAQASGTVQSIYDRVDHPTAPASPAPLTPNGLAVDGTLCVEKAKNGTSSARGIA